MNTPNDFADLIDYYLDKLDRNSAWLARKVGRDAATISRWRSGECHPRSFADIMRITRAFGIKDEHEQLCFFEVVARYYD